MNNSISKKSPSGVPQTVASKSTVGDKLNETKPPAAVSVPVMAKITQPTLDDKHRYLLEGTKDKVKQLNCIIVRFFPNNLQEVTFEVLDDDGNSTEMGTTAFQRYLVGLNRKTGEGEAVKSAKGFASKVFKRLLVDLSDDSVAAVRAVQASKMPKAAERLMGLTQEQWKAKGLGDPAKVLEYWSGVPETVHREMDEWASNFSADSLVWSRRLEVLVHEHDEAERAIAERKAKKIHQPSQKKVPDQPVAQWADEEGEEEELPPKKGQTLSGNAKEFVPTGGDSGGGTSLKKREVPPKGVLTKAKGIFGFGKKDGEEGRAPPPIHDEDNQGEDTKSDPGDPKL